MSRGPSTKGAPKSTPRTAFSPPWLGVPGNGSEECFSSASGQSESPKTLLGALLHSWERSSGHFSGCSALLQMAARIAILASKVSQLQRKPCVFKSQSANHKFCFRFCTKSQRFLGQGMISPRLKALHFQITKCKSQVLFHVLQWANPALVILL